MATKKTAGRLRVEVHLDAAELGPIAHIGNLFPGEDRVDLPSFEYTEDWLASKAAISIDPQLDLVAGEQHSRDGLCFGVFADSAPDRWGRMLMERREMQSAINEGRDRARMNDLFFMLGVNDFTRSGALRFRVPPGRVFADDGPLPAPPGTDLRELATVAKKLDGPRPEDMPAYEQWLSMLVAPGTSLFRRAVFNLLVGNRDDHLRNHGFLLSPSGWRLAPAFDINPNPAKSHHALTWDGVSDASSLGPLLATTGFYRLDAKEASAIVEEVRAVVSGWQGLAHELDLPRVEIATMTRSFNP